MASSVDTTNSFVTLDEVRRHLDLDPGDVERDGVLIAIINHTALLFNQYTGRSLKERAHSNVFLDGDDTELLYLPNWPVDRAQTFTLYADAYRSFGSSTLLTMWDQSSNIGSADFMLIEDDGLCERLNDYTWPDGRRTIKVSYTAGIPGDENHPVIQAQLLQVAQFWQENGKELLQQYSEGGASFQLASVLGPTGARARSLHPRVRETLQSERRVIL